MFSTCSFLSRALMAKILKLMQTPALSSSELRTHQHPANYSRRNLVGLSCVKIRIYYQYVNLVVDELINLLLD